MYIYMRHSHIPLWRAPGPSVDHTEKGALSNCAESQLDVVIDPRRGAESWCAVSKCGWTAAEQEGRPKSRLKRPVVGHCYQLITRGQSYPERSW